jgi:hypothetical protein
MQNKNFNTDKDKQEYTAPLEQPNEETTERATDEGVVYVTEQESEDLDLSERTYVSMEELGEEESAEEDDVTDEDE